MSVIAGKRQRAATGGPKATSLLAISSSAAGLRDRSVPCPRGPRAGAALPGGSPRHGRVEVRDAGEVLRLPRRAPSHSPSSSPSRAHSASSLPIPASLSWPAHSARASAAFPRPARRSPAEGHLPGLGVQARRHPSQVDLTHVAGSSAARGPARRRPLPGLPLRRGHAESAPGHRPFDAHPAYPEP